MQKLQNWLSMVANPAPAVPISKTKMKMGSSTMLISAPAMMPNMPFFGRPWNRSWLLSVKDAAIKGVPMRIYCIYPQAWGKMVSVAPRSRARSSMKMSPTTAITTPTPKQQKNPEDSRWDASSCRCSPRALDMALPEPWPKKSPVAMMMAMRENTTPTAPVALVPINPTK